MPRYLILLLCFLAAEPGAVELIAHRANACGAIENSIDAVKAAWNIGAHAVELDVQVSSDGTAYVFHDDEIEGHLLPALKYSDIRKITGLSIAPKLVDVLRLGTPSGYYVLDLKESAVRHPSAVIAAVQETETPPGKIAFQSNNAPALKQLRDAMPGSQSFYLTRLRRKFPFFVAPAAKRILRQIKPENIDRISFKGRDFVNRSFVAELRSHGYRINVWTINDSERAAYYADIGVDGIITDTMNSLAAGLGRNVIDGSRCQLGGYDDT